MDVKESLKFIQKITIDPIHGYGTSIYEYAIPEKQIIFNHYAEQINVIDDVYYISRFFKGHGKQEIEVPDSLVDAVVQLRDSKKTIIDALSTLADEKSRSEKK